MQDKRIFLIGGGTAGHIHPLFAVLEKLKKDKKYNCEFKYFGSGKQIERNVAKSYKIEYQKLICGKFRRNASIFTFLENIIDVFLVLVGFIQSIIIFTEDKPDLIFSKSGYVSVPMVLAAKLFRIPVIAHESDLEVSLSTKLILPYVKRLAVAFPLKNYSRQITQKAFYSGIPLRSEFDDKRNIREKFVLILGGSSGARDLNNDFFNIVPEVLKKHDVVHITGETDFERAKEFRSGLPAELVKKYEVSKYSENVDELIRRSEFIISRAGATTMFEIAAFDKKAIFVPISRVVTDHQSVNADYIKTNKMGLIYKHENGPSKLLEKIEKMSSFETKISELSFPRSSELMAKVILDELEYQDFLKIKSIFMIGILGVSMNGLANIFKALNKKVEGSDAKIGGHCASNINIGQELVVYSSAASKSSAAKVEHDRAESLNIPVVKRSAAIGNLLKGFCAISVSGMHGKTTTSSLLAQTFGLADFSPSFLIGAEPSENNPTSKLNSGLVFIAEACEYDGSFLDFPTFAAIITNIEEEHLDYFKGGISQIYDEFGKFIENIYPGGLLVYCNDDKNSLSVVSKYMELLKSKNIALISYGFKPSSDFSIRDYKTDQDGLSFQIKTPSKTLELKSMLMGQHLALDCAAVAAISEHYGLTSFEVEQAFEMFNGASRRFEFIGERDGVKIFDDYGHHPSEIETTLKALGQRFPKSKQLIIYEPHQQNRMNNFFNDFVRVFKNSKADKIGILPVYKVAGRDDKDGKSSEDLVNAINVDNEKAIYFRDYDAAKEFISKNAKKGDIVLTMGATNVYEVGTKYFLEG